MRGSGFRAYVLICKGNGRSAPAQQKHVFLRSARAKSFGAVFPEVLEACAGGSSEIQRRFQTACDDIVGCAVPTEVPPVTTRDVGKACQLKNHDIYSNPYFP